MPETPIQSPSAAQRLQGTSIEEHPQMTEQIGLLQNPSSPVLTTSKQNRAVRSISSLAIMVKRPGGFEPSFEVYNDDEELLLKGKIAGKKGNLRELIVFTSDNDSFLKLEFEEDETSQDIKAFNITLPEQNTVLASVDFDRKATSTSIRDVIENLNYTVKYESSEIAIKAPDGRDLAKIMVKTEVTTNMGGFKPTSKSPIFALTFEPGIRPEQKVIFIGYTIAIGVFFSKETRTTLYGGIFFILLILVVCVGIFIYFTNQMPSPTDTSERTTPQQNVNMNNTGGGGGVKSVGRNQTFTNATLNNNNSTTSGGGGGGGGNT